MANKEPAAAIVSPIKTPQDSDKLKRASRNAPVTTKKIVKTIPGTPN
jgi:hypothetical protein